MAASAQSIRELNGKRRRLSSHMACSRTGHTQTCITMHHTEERRDGGEHI